VSWSDLSDWWRTELLDDPAYEADVTPLILDLLNASAGERVLDVGCGEGRLMATLVDVGARPLGVDISQDLLKTAGTFGPVVRQSLPHLSVFRNGVVDAAVVSLVLEHLEDEETLLAELGRVVRPGGRLAIVANHPVFTAPYSAPIQESDEVLWRPGRYFERGYTDEKAGEGTVRFHHRTMAQLLNSASLGGWDLERLVELGATDAQIESHPPLADQRHIPRLLGVAWRRRDEARSGTE
jgi:SAM-dependent methyltransferase